MFITKIKSLYGSLTVSEMKIADYLLANIDNMKSITSSELAKKLDVGQSTIIRFSQKLGYKTFKILINDVIASSSEEESSEIQLTDSMYATLEKVKNNYISSIEVAFNSNQPESFEKASALMNRAENIVCFGYQATGGFAEYLSQSLIELGKSSYYSSSIIEVKQRLLFLNSGIDILVLISKSGETAEINAIAEFAQTIGIDVISITNFGNTTLSTFSLVSINFLYDSQKTRLTAYTQNGGLIFVIDALILSLYKQDYSKYRNKSGNYLKFSRPQEYKE
ncbi:MULTISPECIES: MurR/RpiR family transcriptional regulator [Enterococcus]|jgi:DNA-binding MurR/RpiR family transcriptional regulator|uniref:MurR/RpiR family transcriptional regulator n=1 Tax=Enterococcus TaxID=1350 RepID=UPI0010CA47F3|nr:MULTISPECIES: MurR/RpiR family transcriptional regulator [Enterococcus]MDT2556740.1 MurR/RpiR family transcriptional regulator [Enterococcus raffinosus]QCQ10699.1 MurR/RpiR family transcriptional regulator [Enterococcus avium]